MSECYKRHEVAPGVHQDIPHTTCMPSMRRSGPGGLEFYFQFGDGWKPITEDDTYQLLAAAYPGFVRRT